MELARTFALETVEFTNYTNKGTRSNERTKYDADCFGIKADAKYLHKKAGGETVTEKI